MVVGDNIVDVFDESGVASVGGNCLNVAVHLDRFGVPARYIGSVGDDALGTAVLSALETAGFATDHITRRRGVTGYAMIHHTDGERHFGDFDRGASVVHLGEREWEALAGAELIHSSYSSVLEDHLPRLAAIAPISFDFDSHFDDDYLRTLAPFVAHGFFSAAERAVNEIATKAEELIADGMRTVTMTRADRGALHFTSAGTWSVDAEDITAADTLGAGDAFIAGVVAGIVRGDPIPDMLQAATRRAGEVCTTIGSLGLYVDADLVQLTRAAR